jgi:hypothetical protein
MSLPTCGGEYSDDGALTVCDRCVWHCVAENATAGGVHGADVLRERYGDDLAVGRIVNVRRMVWTLLELAIEQLG